MTELKTLAADFESNEEERARQAASFTSDPVFLMTLWRMNRRDITSHEFLSMFRDWAAERTNMPRAVCEAALSRTLRDKTEVAYHRTDLFERRRDLMESWSAYATTKSADIVAIGAR